MTELITIPYVGQAMVRDLNQIGIICVEDLVGKSHEELFERLCTVTRNQQDLCVLDTFEMAIHFSQTGESFPWWYFSRMRKQGIEYDSKCTKKT